MVLFLISVLMLALGLLGSLSRAISGLVEGNLGSWSHFITIGGIMYLITQQPSIGIENQLAWTFIPAILAAGWGYKE